MESNDGRIVWLTFQTRIQGEIDHTIKILHIPIKWHISYGYVEWVDDRDRPVRHPLGTLEIRNTRKKLIQMPRLVTPKSITQCLLLYKLGGTLDRGIEPEEIIQSSSSTGKRWRCLMCQCLGWWCWCCWWCLSVRRRELSLWRAIRRSWARAPGQFSSTTIPLTSAAADSGSSNLAFVST